MGIRDRLEPLTLGTPDQPAEIAHRVDYQPVRAAHLLGPPALSLFAAMAPDPISQARNTTQQEFATCETYPITGSRIRLDEQHNTGRNDEIRDNSGT